MKYIGLILFCLLCAATSFAQTSKGFVTGNVVDPNGAAVPNVNITITNTATGTTRQTVSQENGSYRLDAVDPGTYNIEASATGFNTAKNQNISVSSAQTVEVNLQLAVGGTAATVDVLAAGTVELQTSDGSRSNTFESRQITELPVAGFNPANLVFTQPGVIDLGPTRAGGFVQGTEFSSNGLRARANNQLIDGLDNNDNSITGQAYQPSVRDGYSEVAILQSNYSAEFGRAGGTVVNVVTRSGTNQFRGSAYDIIQNSAFNSLTPGQRQQGLTKVPQQTQNTFGGSIGGPLYLPRFGEGGPAVFGGKNKLFFFGTFQADLIRSNAVATGNVPTTAGFNTLRSLFPAGTNPNLDYYLGIVGNSRGSTNPFLVPLSGGRPAVEFGTVSQAAPQPVNTYDYITRVDYTPSSRDTFNIRYLATKQRFTNQFPTVFQGFEVDVPSFTQNLYTNYTRNFTPNLTNELRFGYGFVNVNFTPRTDNGGPQISFAGQGLGAGGITAVGQATTFPQGRRFNNYQFQDTITYTIGNNTFRTGADVNLQRASQVVPFNTRGTFTFSGNNAINALSNFIDGVSGVGGSINRSFGSPVVFPNSFFQAYFINDEWKVRSNLTLNLGLRYENYGTPFNKAAFPAFAGFGAPITTVVKQKADKNNFAPRFSFAYSPSFKNRFVNTIIGEKDTVIRGGFAVGYDIFFNNILGNTAASSPNVRGIQLLGRTGGSRGIPALITALPSNAPFSSTAPITSIDANLQNPESYVYNLGIQRRIRQDYILDVAYVGSRGLKLFINEQLNPFAGFGLRRVNPAFGGVTLRTNGGDSNYNSLQVRFERGFKNGFLLRSTYTFSKAIDDVNSEVFVTSGGSSVSSDPSNRRTDRSVATYDVPHVFTLTGLFNVPTFGAEGIARKIFNGFTLGAIYRLQSGGVETPYVGGIDLNGDGNVFNDRPQLNNPSAPSNSVAFFDGNTSTGYSDVNGNPINPSNARYLVVNPSDVNPDVVGFVTRTGVAGRNTLRGPIFNRLDMSLQREFGIGGSRFETLRFQVRADFFNVLNIPTYGPGNGDVTDPLFNNPYTFNPALGDTTNGGASGGTRRTGRFQLRLTF